MYRQSYCCTTGVGIGIGIGSGGGGMGVSKMFKFDFEVFHVIVKMLPYELSYTWIGPGVIKNFHAQLS